MATLEQLGQALINADKAGDADAARALADEITKMQAGGGEGQAMPPDPVQRPPLGAWDTVKDVGSSLTQGWREGYEGGPGMGGDIYNMEVDATEWLAKKLGAPESVMASIRESRGKNWLPDSGDISEKTTPALGEPYQPKSEYGDWARTAGAFMTNPSRGFVRNVVAPTIGTEIGGKIGEEYGMEGAGRFAGGVGGGALPSAGMRVAAGPQMSPRRVEQVDLMRREGIPLTGGQATDRKALKYLETGAFGGSPESIRARQDTAFNRAALRRADMVGDDAGPNVMADQRDALGLEYDDLVARNNGVPLDPQLQQELFDTTVGYQRLKGQGGPQIVEDYFNRILDAGNAAGGVVPPDVFQSIRSDIAKTLRTSTDAETQIALRSMQDQLFEGIARNGQPEIVAQARDLNTRYRNFKVLERTQQGNSEAIAAGNITPKNLQSAVAKGDKGAQVYGRGDFSDLANAGVATMTPLPQSGSTARLAPIAALGGVGNALFNGDLKGAATWAGGAALPWAASKFAASRPFSRAVMDQASGRSGGIINPMNAALAARQADIEERRRAH